MIESMGFFKGCKSIMHGVSRSYTAAFKTDSAKKDVGFSYVFKFGYNIMFFICSFCYNSVFKKCFVTQLCNVQTRKSS